VAGEAAGEARAALHRLDNWAASYCESFLIANKNDCYLESTLL